MKSERIHRLILCCILLCSTLFSLHLSAISKDDILSKLNAMNTASALGGSSSINLNTQVTVIKLQKITPRDAYFYGEVLPSDKAHISFEVSGIIDNIINPGEYVISTLYDDNGEVVRQGTFIAGLRKERFLYAIRGSQNEYDSSVKEADYLAEVTKRLEKVYQKGLLSVIDFIWIQFDEFKAKLDMDTAAALLEQSKLDLRRSDLYSPITGFVEKVLKKVGDTTSLHSDPVALISKIDPVVIKITLPLDILGIFDKSNIGIIYLNRTNKTESYPLQLSLLDKKSLFILADNEIHTANKITSKHRHYKKVYQTLQVVPITTDIEDFFYKNLLDSQKIIAVPVQSIRYDNSEPYVFKVKDKSGSFMESGLSRVLKVERVPIQITGISTKYPFNYEENLMVKSIKPTDKLKAGDLLVGKAEAGIKDGDNIVRANITWKFLPYEKVKILIPSLTKPGFYVPRESIIHVSDDEDFVYLVEDGRAVLKKIILVGYYNGYYAIKGKGIKNDAEVVIVDTPYLYDGLEVTVSETLPPPFFISNIHALDSSQSTSNAVETKHPKGGGKSAIGKDPRIMDYFNKKMKL